jgi:hypothetical protein
MKDENPNKNVFSRRLLGKLYDMGLIPTADTLERLNDVSASSFCRRRLPSMMVTIGLMNNVSFFIKRLNFCFNFRSVNLLKWSKKVTFELDRN